MKLLDRLSGPLCVSPVKFRLPAPVLQFSNVEAPGEEITGRKTYKVYKTI